MIYLDRLPGFIAELETYPDPAIVDTAEYLGTILAQVQAWNASWPPKATITLDQARNAGFYQQSQTYPDRSVQVLLSWALTTLNQVGDMNQAIRSGATTRSPGGAAQGYWG